MAIRNIVPGFLMAFCLAAVMVNATPARSPIIPPKEQAATEASEDIAVFKSLLATRFQTNGKSVVVVKDTVAWEQLAHMLTPHDIRLAEREGVPASLCQAFIARNKKTQILPEFKAVMPLIFAREKEITAIFKAGFWQKFYKTYPGTAGLVSFSLPAYSPDRSAALIFFRRDSDVRSGADDLFYMKKSKKGWQVVRSLGGGMS